LSTTSVTTTKVLYHNDGDTSFTDVSVKAGIAQTAIPLWAGRWLHRLRQRRLAGPAHGQRPRCFPDADQYDWGTTWAERPLLFHNVPYSRKGAALRIHSAGERNRTGSVIPARGAAFGDLLTMARRARPAGDRRWSALVAGSCPNGWPRLVPGSSLPAGAPDPRLEAPPWRRRNVQTLRTRCRDVHPEFPPRAPAQSQAWLQMVRRRFSTAC